jgi:hypothetical protein
MKSTNKFSLLLLTQITAIVIELKCAAQKADMPKLRHHAGCGRNTDRTLKFEQGFPTEETKQKVFDEIDYQRAVQLICGLPRRFISIYDDRGQTGLWRRISTTWALLTTSLTPNLSGSPQTMSRSTPFANIDLGKQGPSSLISRPEPSLA